VSSGLETEAGADALEEIEQLLQLRFRERITDLPIEPDRSSLGLPEELLAGSRQVEVPDAAVASVRPALEQPAPLQLVDDRDHPAGGDVQALGQRVLSLTVSGRHRAHEGELSGLELQRLEHVLEATGDRVAEAREQEGDTPERGCHLFDRFGLAYGHNRMIQLPKDSATE
jgi:hypothetical protein